MAADSTIVVSALKKAFEGELVVDGLSFTVNAGEIFGLVGPDGAGKSTTLRMLAGVLRADAGKVFIAGHDMLRDPESARAVVSYMPQRFGLYQDLTVDENIRFYSDLFGVPRQVREERAARLLRSAELDSVRTRLAGHLSGGMKQKLGLVCALIHTPRALLLDEPTNGVDPVARREFWRILYSLLGEGVAIATSTAYLDEAERCHRVAMVHHGRFLLCDTPERLRQGLHGGVITATAPDPRAVRAALADAPGVRSAVLFGDAVHVFVDQPELRARELRALVASAGVAIDELAVAQPTLEDVFVAALEKQPP
jgi:ABC-2 type transport system ATP-binding protein